MIKECQKINERLKLLEKCPLNSGFKLGDKVIYTNDYGIKFTKMICGFSSNSDLFRYGCCIHLCDLNEKIDGNAWWYPHNPDCLRKIF